MPSSAAQAAVVTNSDPKAAVRWGIGALKRESLFLCQPSSKPLTYVFFLESQSSGEAGADHTEGSLVQDLAATLVALWTREEGREKAHLLSLPPDL